MACGPFLSIDIEHVVRLTRNNGLRRWFLGRDRAFEEQIAAYLGLGTFHVPEETVIHLAALYEAARRQRDDVGR